MKGIIVLTVASTLLNVSQAWIYDNCILPVKNTAWDVSSFEQAGAISGYHPTPWVFQSNGKVSAAGYWKATWKRSTCDKINVNLITDREGEIDKFDVIFVTSSRFVAVKNNMLYRFGKRR